MNPNIFNNDIDLWDLVDDITIAFNSDISSVSDSIKYLENNTSDEAMLVTILLWLFPHSPFEHIEHSNNSFFNLFSGRNFGYKTFQYEQSETTQD